MKKLIDLRIEDLYYLNKEIELVSNGNTSSLLKELVSILDKDSNEIMFSFKRFYDIVSTCENPQSFLDSLGIDSRNFDKEDIIQIVDSIDSNRDICYLTVLGFSNSFSIFNLDRLKENLQNKNYEVNENETLLRISQSDKVKKLEM